MGRLLSAALSVFACLNAMLAIVYSHRTAADPNLAQQNHDLWTEAAFFAALCVVAAPLVVSARRLLIVAAAIVLFLLGLIALGDIVNARTLTALAIGLVFLIGSLAGASVALAATVIVLLRPTRSPSQQLAIAGSYQHQPPLLARSCSHCPMCGIRARTRVHHKN